MIYELLNLYFIYLWNIYIVLKYMYEIHNLFYLTFFLKLKIYDLICVANFKEFVQFFLTNLLLAMTSVI